MAKFKCGNSSCTTFDLEINLPKVKWVFDNGTNKMNHTVKCPLCEEQMVYIKEEQSGDIDVYFAKFNAMSNEDKKAVLKKRAKHHTMTKMKDRIPEVRKRLLKGM